MAALTNNSRRVMTIMFVILIVAIVPWSATQSSAPDSGVIQDSATANQSSVEQSLDESQPDALSRLSADCIVSRTDFGPESDANYDGWPDDWKRQTGQGFPHYVAARIKDDADSNHALCVTLNGGAFMAKGPLLPIDPDLTYDFSHRVKNLGTDDKAYLGIQWLDAQRQVIGENRSSPAAAGSGWATQTIPSTAGPHAARFVRPVIETRPSRLADLQGEIWFDDLTVSCAPRIDLAIDRPANRPNFIRPREAVNVRIGVNGLFGVTRHATLRVGVTDVLGEEVLPPREFALVEEHLSTEVSAPAPGEAENHGGAFHTNLQLPPTGPGYFQLTATLVDGQSAITARQIAWIVIEENDKRLPVDFSWAADDGAGPLSDDQLVAMVADAEVGWLKFPVWAPPDDAEEIDRLAKLAEQLAAHEVRVIGLLNHPPDIVLNQMEQGAPRNAAGIFSMPDANWYPHLLPTQRRIAMSVRRWQLGSDNDLSFVGYRNLSAQLTQVKSALDRLGHDVELSLAWNWLYPLPPMDRVGRYREANGRRPAPWTDISLSAIPALSPTEMGRYLAADDSTAPAALRTRRWINVRALSDQSSSVSSRAANFAKQIIAAKAHGADGINLPQALHPAQGMIHADGSPGKLFLVWRTLANVLSGAQYLGSFRLPDGSSNAVFVRAGEATMFVWNDRPTAERLALGDDVQASDLWGRKKNIRLENDEHVFDVGPTPIILTGLSETIARFRLSVQLDSPQVPAVLGRTFANSVSWSNPFPYPISGRVTIPSLTGWNVRTGSGEFRILESETAAAPFYANFPYATETGTQLLKLEFRVVADRDYRFAVYRDIELGMAEVQWDVTTHIDRQGVLHIEHRLRNFSETPRRVRVMLNVPNRQRIATPLLPVEPGMIYHDMSIPNCDDLRGETALFRLEEPGTNRFLNKRIVLEK